MATPANLALQDDPRLSDVGGGKSKVELAMLHAMHDRNVTFEEYMHYGYITRADEKAENEQHKHLAGPRTIKSTIMDRFSTGKKHNVIDSPPSQTLNEKDTLDGGDKSIVQPGGNSLAVSDAEWKRASRAIRTAGWGSVFYLITTDILGPYSVPWALAQMGYGPGIALYTVFGVMAGYSGFYLWRIFLHLDSDRYPLRSYGDVFFRVFGMWARHAINVLQSIQLLFTVSILILSSGQSISQIAKGKLCFVVCLVVFMAAGMVLGQIRTLQRFGWLANLSVWINLLIIFIVMGVSSNSPPYYDAVEKSFGPAFAEGPIHRYAGTPPAGMASGGEGFVGSLNGLNQAVYSYGGAMLFVAFLAEMRHPMDFWKGLLCAEIFIYVVYLFFGVFVYSYQGQYAYNPVMQGISPYNWRTATNIMNLFTGLIAAVLYGNIGIKVLYTEVFQALFSAPDLTRRAGKSLWVGLVPVYWAVAFLVCAAIPQFSYISGLVGAVCILQFTYTFPAILAVGFQIQQDAMHPDERFDPATRTTNYVDRGLARYVRGFKKHWLLNTFNFLYFLGSLTTAALGIYSSCLGLMSAFDGGSVATSFGCASPA
ncbi:transmembrane amino acid transporter family protein [Phlyctema vagabunda]|uniref:Transmembrane amino acid transporter family protein n=1 Tax=Phlyctema vagabunda TaxID=108571 RepID=A0ABR4PX30_9HELO